MKLLRFGPPGAECPGLLDKAGRIRDLSGAMPSGKPVPHLDALASLRVVEPESLPLVDDSVRMGTPYQNVGKIVACGLNYADHVAESGLSAGDEPTFFIKPTSSLTGPNDPIVIPPGATQVDYEVEFVIVIGRDGAYISQKDALSHVAGYALFNDVSERNWQFNRGAAQWVKGKAADTFGPFGPYFVTADEVDIGNADIWLELNGVRKQQSNTSQLIFPVARMVSYVSGFMSLQAGDLIATGTPAGVGLGQKPPAYMKPGDRLRLGMTGLGEQNNLVVGHAT